MRKVNPRLALHIYFHPALARQSLIKIQYLFPIIVTGYGYEMHNLLQKYFLILSALG